jgi:SAM-dependent methyltransferase
MDRAAYRQFAELEEDHFWFRGRRAIFLSLLDRQLAHRTSGRVLEVGCGAGGLLRRLDRYGSHPVGLELDPELAALCQERASGASAVCGSAYDLPFRSASEDLVALFDTLEHLEDEAGALREVARVLRPGGLVVVSVPAYQFLYANNDRVAHHHRRYTRRRLRRVLEGHGFRRRKATYFNTLLFPAILPAVLLGKAKERLVGVDPDHTNLSYAPPRLLNRFLAGVMSSERFVLGAVDLPVGHSIVGVWSAPGQRS